MSVKINEEIKHGVRVYLPFYYHCFLIFPTYLLRDQYLFQIRDSVLIPVDFFMPQLHFTKNRFHLTFISQYLEPWLWLFSCDCHYMRHTSHCMVFIVACGVADFGDGLCCRCLNVI